MSCHTIPETAALATGGCIALVGHPNVGKSVLFQRLTGQHVVVSNYPGTTVEVARSPARSLPGAILVDTPGVVTFPPRSEDERVTARVLLGEDLRAILQVGDAKNLRRTLLLCVQLAEMGLPMALALNMTDEAQRRGIRVNPQQLEELLDLPVIPTIAIKGQGVGELASALQASHAPRFRLDYPEALEQVLAQLVACLPEAPISRRSLALLWLCEDEVTQDWLGTRLEPSAYAHLDQLRRKASSAFAGPLAQVVLQTRLEFISQAARQAQANSIPVRPGFTDFLGRLTMHPFWGWFILAGVLYALYWFVGVLGAGILVNLLEKNLFGGIINPWVTQIVTRLAPFPWVAGLLVGEYGLWTMGMTYALALILPIVMIFFLAFGVLEDSGYLPRLAALSNRGFQSLGLNGKAVLPMVLGMGCVTMATLTTRVLESKRERLLATLLLALAVPCSAQLGVVMGMLAGISFGATLIWGGVVMVVLLAVGWLAARLVPGERTPLLVELPPMRWPQFSNVILKTLARLEWYVKEVVPLFLAGAALMFVLDQTGLLARLTAASQPLVTGWLGLPPQAGAAFIMGFLRRDFGATGLFVMQSQGLMSPAQVVVAMVTVTLLIPCIASVMVIGKERGWRTASGMVVLIIPLAFLVGGLLYRVFLLTGWGL
jgi:ferrous iron transport protein B